MGAADEPGIPATGFWIVSGEFWETGVVECGAPGRVFTDLPTGDDPVPVGPEIGPLDKLPGPAVNPPFGMPFPTVKGLPAPAPPREGSPIADAGVPPLDGLVSPVLVTAAPGLVVPSPLSGASSDKRMTSGSVPEVGAGALAVFSEPVTRGSLPNLSMSEFAASGSGDKGCDSE